MKVNGKKSTYDIINHNNQLNISSEFVDKDFARHEQNCVLMSKFITDNHYIVIKPEKYLFYWQIKAEQSGSI